MIKLVPEKFTGIYKKRLSFKWNEFRVYFGFHFFWIHILNSIPSLPTGRCLTLAPWNRTRICLARPLWFYPSSSLFSSFFESVIKVPLHFRSPSYAFSTSIFFFFDSFAFFFFIFSPLPPFAFFLLSFFRSFCSFRFLFAARGWRTLRAHSKCFPLAERAHCTPILSWQIFWDRGIFRDLEIMIILCYCWVEWKGNFFLAFMASPSFFLSNSKLFSVIIFRFLKFEVTATRIFIILILLNYINL